MDFRYYLQMAVEKFVRFSVESAYVMICPIRTPFAADRYQNAM